LTGQRVVPIDATFEGCAEPQLAARLWATGFTHVLVREPWERQWLADHADEEGWLVEARFADADILAVRPRSPSIYVQQSAGFWPREHDADATWRWMGTDASWTIVAGAPRSKVMLDLDASAFQVTR